MPEDSRDSVLRVALNLPLRKTFDYSLPVDWDNPAPRPGVRIRVPFGKQQLIGVLIKVHSDWPDFKLKPILEQIDDEPILDHHLLELLAWSSAYYCHPVGEVIAASLPARLRKGKPATPTSEKRWALNLRTGQSYPNLAGAPKQQAIIDFLSTKPDGASRQELNDQFVHWRASMRALLEKQLVSVETCPAHRTEADCCCEDEYPLNPAQEKAFNTVSTNLNRYTNYLLYGVTGSGKTEVYLHLAREVMARGKQVLILVPEIGLTPQLAARFRKRFSCNIVIMHSGLNETERADAWLHAKTGDARIIIGTRSAVYIPMQTPGIIIIDEEHDSSFKQMEGFRYSARDIAIKRAAMLDIPVVLGSATPAIESFSNVRQGRSTLLHLPTRTGNSTHPEIILLDMRSQQSVAGLVPRTLGVIRDELANDGQVLIFLNRRGYAPMLRCESCGWVAECHHCDIRMTVHRRDARLRCHVCSYETSIPEMCPGCGANSLHTIGHGTEKLEEVLREYFADTEIIRVDRDTTRAKDSFMKILGQVNTGGRKILIGTQMLAKGHHFPEIGTVVVHDADNGLYGLDFRAQEHMAQLIIQVAGRAGRASRPGTVYIQTWHPDHPFFQSLQTLPYSEFANQLLDERNLTSMPPYSYLALLRVESAKQQNTEEFTQAAADAANEFRPNEIELLGPAISPLERKAGFFRMQILVRSADRRRLHNFLSDWVHHMEAMKSGKRVRWSLDIDPYSLY